MVDRYLPLSYSRQLQGLPVCLCVYHTFGCIKSGGGHACHEQCSRRSQTWPPPQIIWRAFIHPPSPPHTHTPPLCCLRPFHTGLADLMNTAACFRGEPSERARAQNAVRNLHRLQLRDQSSSSTHVFLFSPFPPLSSPWRARGVDTRLVHVPLSSVAPVANALESADAPTAHANSRRAFLQQQRALPHKTHIACAHAMPLHIIHAMHTHYTLASYTSISFCSNREVRLERIKPAAYKGMDESFFVRMMRDTGLTAGTHHPRYTP